MAARDLGYRRFFDINSLVGLRIENERVFYATHRLVMRWVAEGRVQGLRIDHPDGLRDPLEYFQRLRAACPDTWIVAETILLGSESLRLALCEANHLNRDTSHHEAHEVIRATMASLPIYRTYVRESGEVAPEDECQIVTAIEAAKTYRSDLDARLFDFLRDILSLRTGGKIGAELALRFPQI